VRALAGFDLVRYAQKANGNLALLRALRAEGVAVDAVSRGEIERALRAGYGAEDIVFTADLFTEDCLARVVELGLTVNCGSEDMIEQYAEAGGRRPLTLRVNPGFGHGHHRRVDTGGPHSKHGIWHEFLSEALRRLDATGLELGGLHLHIGSGADPEHLERVAQAMETLVLRVGRPLETISAGGGLPVRYREEDEEMELGRFQDTWFAARERISSALGRRPRLEVEPGRFLVAEAGVMLARVRATKRVADRRLLLVDAGFHNLPRHLLYGAHHEIAVVGKELRRSDGGDEVLIAGPLCESSDLFTVDGQGEPRPRRLPRADVGDLLIFADAGAYAAAMGSHYNAMPLAAELVLDSGREVDFSAARAAPHAEIEDSP
jgi:diaminopimelate decarboxylase